MNFCHLYTFLGGEYDVFHIIFNMIETYSHVNAINARRAVGKSDSHQSLYALNFQPLLRTLLVCVWLISNQKWYVEYNPSVLMTLWQFLSAMTNWKRCSFINKLLFPLSLSHLIRVRKFFDAANVYNLQRYWLSFWKLISVPNSSSNWTINFFLILKHKFNNKFCERVCSWKYPGGTHRWKRKKYCVQFVHIQMIYFCDSFKFFGP